VDYDALSEEELQVTTTSSTSEAGKVSEPSKTDSQATMGTKLGSIEEPLPEILTFRQKKELARQEREKLDKLAVQRYCMSKKLVDGQHRLISEKVMSVMAIRDKSQKQNVIRFGINLWLKALGLPPGPVQIWGEREILICK
jgi:hypothetical protein